MVQRLATYGTLSPGRRNHHHVAGVPGRWFSGTVRGRLLEAGWGAVDGFPAIVLDPAGDEVAVDVLESAELEDEWARLDDFEGPGYARTLVSVTTPQGPVSAYIYALAQ